MRQCLRGQTRSHRSGTEAALERGVKPIVLLSVLVATFAIPVWLIRRPGRVSHVVVLKATLVCIAVYVCLLLFVYPRLS